ncbi:unnamed protein product [Prunus armeniaca]
MSQRSHGSTCLCATRDKRQRYCFLIKVIGAAASLFKGESLEREEDALVSLFPLIGSSSVRHFTSTAYLLGVTGVLAPILEETFKLVCWKVEAGLTSNLPPRVPTPVAIGISAVVFALAHLTPEEFPSCLC